MRLTLLSEQIKPTAAVAIVRCGDRWLLGLARTQDDRNGTWLFPGGGIDRGESIKAAAVREAHEETGIRCRAAGEPFSDIEKPHVAFVYCETTRPETPRTNSEFTTAGWFTLAQLSGLVLYRNVGRLLNRVCQHA